MKKKLMLKNGFTLSEVLVTLAVVGLVAAFITPAVTRITPDNNKVMLRKAYNSLEQAVETMINDDIIYSSINTVVCGSTFCQQGFNNTTATTESGSKNKFCYYLAKTLNVTGGDTCPANNISALTFFGRTGDGIEWYIYPGSATPASQFPVNTAATAYTTRIVVDVNGDKGPNCSRDTGCSTFSPGTNFTCSTTCSNPDVFFFGVRNDGSINPGMSGAAGTAITDQNVINYLADPVDMKK